MSIALGYTHSIKIKINQEIERKGTMNKILKKLDNIEENLIAIILPLMCIVVFMATFFRYTKLLVIPWGEELSRYMMIWIIFLGIGTATRRNAHFAVGAFVDILPKTLQKYIAVLRTLIVIGFSVVIVVLSLKIMMAQMNMGQTSPALRIPMWTAYAAIPVGCALMIIRSIQSSVEEFLAKGKERFEEGNKVSEKV
jgi:C4-dicarboxylate transporter, DctQ subunit